MADDVPRSQMSIIPYSSNRDVVLRHNDSVVILDRDSQQLVLRDARANNGEFDIDLSDCPYCHRPMRSREDGTETHQSTSPSSHSDFVTPDYFRLLHDSAPSTGNGASRPPSPRRRFQQPALTDGSTENAQYEQSPSPGQGISSASFSQGYFKKFFVEEKELGRGGKGVVLLVKHVLDGVSLGHFACKRVPVGDDHVWLEKVLVEVQLLQHLSHQNLVSYRHVWLENAKISTFSPSVPCAFILQQYCNAGDLHNYVFGSMRTSTSTTQQLKERLRRRSKGQRDTTPVEKAVPRTLQFEDIYSFFKDITSGIRYLHANGYIHRDLKPSNCLLHDSGNELRVLVSDFGEVQYEKSVRSSTGTTGTISYCAPEVLQRVFPDGPFGNFTFKSDVFSLGMILHFLCFARLPYQSADIIEENEDIDELREEISHWTGFDDSLKRLRPDLPDKLYVMLKRLLSVDPDWRPTADEVLNTIQAGVNGNESRRFARASSNGPEFRSVPRIQPVDSPGPASRHPPRSPRKSLSRNNTRSLGSPERYEARATTAASESTPGPSTGTDNSSSSHRTEHDLILRPRYQDMSSTSPRRRGQLDEQQHQYGRPILHHQHSPPLLPPPPESFLTSGSYILYIPIGSWGWLPVPSARFAFFIIKQIITLQPCMPRAVNPWVYYPLVMLAVLSLPIPGLKAQLLSLAVHLFIMAISAYMNAICIRNSSSSIF